jgi:hypothetical protein
MVRWGWVNTDPQATVCYHSQQTVEMGFDGPDTGSQMIDTGDTMNRGYQVDHTTSITDTGSRSRNDPLANQIAFSIIVSDDARYAAGRCQCPQRTYLSLSSGRIHWYFDDHRRP